MKPLRILLLEDDMVVAPLLAEILKAMGHEICAIAATKADAIAAAAQYKPELMIVDVRLGEENGIAVVQIICSARFTPHLFMSGDISRIRMPSSKAVVIQKPFREVDLIHAMQRALETGALIK